ncbi:hypothetical protein H8D99_00750 [bacterium]|nr:hypothetical protein [bacterium]
MEQFDNTFKNTKESTPVSEPARILILGSVMSTVDAIRASLEVHGHTVSQTSSLSLYEKLSCKESFEAIFVATDDETIENNEFFELISLLDPSAIVVGYCEDPAPDNIIQFIRDGGKDYLNFPSDLNNVGDRVATLLQTQREVEQTEEQANNTLQLCEKLNEDRKKAEEENDTLNHQLANAYCDTKKKMQQVAIGAEFQTLVSQELDVESMLRTALGYMLTRIGAMNAVVYLSEGEIDWGVGAYINYDRQSEQFQSLIDTMSSSCCSLIGAEEEIKHFTNGETFADVMDLDVDDFTGSEVAAYGCYAEDKCMAVVILFRDSSRPFTAESLDTVDTLRSIFGQQLNTILKIHRRASTKWPSESIDDDDWSIDKAA